LTKIAEFQNLESGQPPVRGFLHSPDKISGDALVLTHGAGSNCNSPLLRMFADAFCEAGIAVLRIDLPFRQLRAHGPPRGSAENDQQGLRRAVELMREKSSKRVFLGGHSYGGRQSTMLAAANPELADGLLLLSYPLHPPKRPDQLRTAHFPKLRTPALFFHGTRDGFGTIEEMQAAIALIDARVQLVPVTGAGHELMSKSSKEGLSNIAVEAFKRFFNA
jgi:predicted alpha/beta-hydrolase family hydrolase